ncbi:MAG: hypothetical protein GXY74_08260 [Phycisphaerae bacterium]|nr:hypothetical protein [Phycisphaerae bacterium]
MKYGMAAGVVLAVAMAAGGVRAADNEVPSSVATVPITATVYTSDNAPAAPAVEALARHKSISQYGVTWTFETEAPAGQFVTGDWYVVGPVRVVKIDPAPLQGRQALKDDGWEIVKKQAVDEERFGEQVGRNGSLLNPTGDKVASGRAGFDSRLADVHYTPTMFEAPPFDLKPGDALISTISNRNLEDFRGYGQPVLTAAVLTCLAAPAPADAFRPSFADRGQRIYLARTLQRDLLYALPRPQTAPEIREWIARFQKPWIDFTNWGYGAPKENMPRYGQHYTGATSTVALMLHLDYPAEEKERLLIEYVQYGIDLAGLVRSGFKGWRGHGGFGGGRKFAVMFAGLMLGDEQMRRPNTLAEKVAFGEDQQTFWGTSWNGAQVVFESHPGWRPDPSEKTHPSKWNQGHYQSESYRLCCTSKEWPGQALAIRLMRAEGLWNHDPFPAYVDRWMTEDLPEHVRTFVTEMEKAKGVDVEANPPKMPWYHRMERASKFVQAMWDAYRQNLPPMKPGMEAWARPAAVAPAADQPADQKAGQATDQEAADKKTP